MAKYNVFYTSTASTVITVEADNAEEAREKAEVEGEFPSICAQCGGWGNRGNSSGIEVSDEWEQDESPNGFILVPDD